MDKKNRSEFDCEEFVEFEVSSILKQINRKQRGEGSLHARIYYRRMNIQRLFNIGCIEYFQLRAIRIRIVQNCE